MPTFKADHDKNRQKVCAPCGKKIHIGKKPIECFKIKANQEVQIKEFINPEYDSTSSVFPISICNTCRVFLVRKEKVHVDKKMNGYAKTADISNSTFIKTR